jgi:hypothetical protein
MNRRVFACVLLLSLSSVAAFAEEMTGMITCAKCRHTDAKQLSCARGCIQGGVAPLFYDTASQKFYSIANPDLVKPHAGQRVVVTGKISGDTLTVEQIKGAAMEKQGS